MDLAALCPGMEGVAAPEGCCDAALDRVILSEGEEALDTFGEGALDTFGEGALDAWRDDGTDPCVAGRRMTAGCTGSADGLVPLLLGIVGLLAGVVAGLDGICELLFDPVDLLWPLMWPLTCRGERLSQPVGQVTRSGPAETGQNRRHADTDTAVRGRRSVSNRDPSPIRAAIPKCHVHGLCF